VSHRCHAQGCAASVPPEMLMCKRHWFMVPPNIRRAVWSTYRDGQCNDKRPSRAWLSAADAAIAAVYTREHSLLARLPPLRGPRP